MLHSLERDIAALAAENSPSLLETFKGRVVELDRAMLRDSAAALYCFTLAFVLLTSFQIAEGCFFLQEYLATKVYEGNFNKSEHIAYACISMVIYFTFVLAALLPAVSAAAACDRFKYEIVNIFDSSKQEQQDTPKRLLTLHWLRI